MQLIKDLKPEFDEITKCSVTRRSALLPILHKVQEKKGCLSESILEEVAEYLQISRSDAFEVATFFALLYDDDIAENVILICESVSCYLVGGESIIEALEAETGAKIGKNSPDGIFTIRAYSCLGACDKSPSLLLNGVLHGHLTVDSIKELVQDCRNNAAG